MFERTGTLVREKFREYLLPTILTSLAMSLASVVDSVIVGNLLGDTALAAVGLCAPLIYCINFIYMLFGIGGMTLSSIARGRREFEKSNAAFTISIGLGVLVMFAFAFSILIFLGPISMGLAGGDEKLADLTADYLAPLLFTGPGLMFASGMALFIRTDGSPKSSATVVLIANAVNLVLDYILIAWCDAGIAGAGLSTTLGYAAGAAVVIPYLVNRKRSFRFAPLTKKTLAVFPGVVKTGMPKAMVQMTAFGRQIILNAIIIRLFGAMGMSVMSVCINVLMISGIFVTGTSDAVLPIIGTLYGEQDYFGIRSAAKSAAKVVGIASIILTIFFELFPALVGSWFGIPDDGAVLQPALRCFALYLPFNAAIVLFQNLYTTTGRARLASSMAALDGFLYVVPFAFLLAFGGMTFWLCYVCSGAATLLTANLMRKRIEKKEHIQDILLLRSQGNEGEVLDVSIPAETKEAAALSEQVIRFCEENGVEHILASRLGVCTEEMAVNTAELAHGEGKKGTIDVFLRITTKDIILRFRDDGTIFDPATYEAGGIDGCTTNGIEVMRKLAEHTEYARQLGFNTTVLTFERRALKKSAER